VPEEVKAERLARLFARSEALLGAHLASLAGTTQRVLIESPGEGGIWSGRTERNEIVHVAGAGDRDLLGEVAEVRVVRSNKHSLAAEATDAALALGRPRVEVARPRRSLPMALPVEGGA
jgi:tRNA-2-methylthio-N6-dimethylallyladenosine synthase